jgi:PadR family transcriptional regulator PadR
VNAQSNYRCRTCASAKRPIDIHLDFRITGQHLRIDIRYEQDNTSFYRCPIGQNLMPHPPAALLKGTLDLLILKALSTGELHGVGVSRRIKQMTGGRFVVQPGSLFPALHRLEEAAWLASRWAASDNNRRAKYYTLTKAGQRQFAEETQHRNRIALAIACPGRVTTCLV